MILGFLLQNVVLPLSARSNLYASRPSQVYGCGPLGRARCCRAFGRQCRWGHVRGAARLRQGGRKGTSVRHVLAFGTNLTVHDIMILHILLPVWHVWWHVTIVNNNVWASIKMRTSPILPGGTAWGVCRWSSPQSSGGSSSNGQFESIWSFWDGQFGRENSW